MDTRGLRILLVDDDEDDYLITRDLLSDIDGGEFDLEWVTAYDAALESMRRNQHDVYLVDFRLGKFNGLELLREAVKYGCKAPTILLTGQGDRKLDIEAMKAGAADYLDKYEIGAPLLERSIRYAVEQHQLLEALKQQTLELQASERRLSTIIANNADGIIIMDKNGIARFVNPAAESLFGLKAEELLDKLFVFPVESSETRELDIARKDGKTAIAEMRVAEIDWKGETAYLASLRDITERKQAEEQIRLLTHQLMKAQESEREKFSRDLHDSVAQDLSALKIGMDTLFDPWPEAPSEMRQRVSECSKILYEVIAAIRNLAYELSPPSLDHLGLGQAIFQYCEEFSAKNKIEVDFTCAGIDDVCLDSDTEINLYRLIQEALNNVKKHADASNVTIRLVASFPKIILRIEDDGKGFDVEKRLVAALNEKRMGLRSMEERVSLLKGKMRIQSRPMQGTKILIEVSYNQK